VTLAHPSGLEAELAALPVEVMSAPVAATEHGGFARAGEKAIDELVAARDVVALGPGIGTDPDTVELVRRIVATIERPLVVDADGLNALQGQLSTLHERSIPAVLTPHPGEAARLLESDAAALNADRVGAARALARASHSVVTLKGAATVVADPDGRALVVPTGGPVLASGGTGDVLTGVVAGLLAAGLPPFEAAGLASWWHGATADRVAQARVGFGLLASELADALPATAEAIATAAGATRDGNGKGGSHGVLALRFPNA
jgi:NAD(P)H-hydrate epimerase